MIITDEQKEIFQNCSNIDEFGKCNSFSLIATWDVQGTKFYNIQYDGDFLYHDKHETTLYAWFFEGYNHATVCASEFAARISALCEYQKVTGKELKR